jgi:hypothetical protein
LAAIYDYTERPRCIKHSMELILALIERIVSATPAYGSQYEVAILLLKVLHLLCNQRRCGCNIRLRWPA